VKNRSNVSAIEERAAFIEKYFQMEWPNQSLYHAMLNTAEGDEAVIHTILSLKDALEQHPYPTQ
jgi:hypothetical protein